MIKPTVGRHVLYTPHINELVARTPDNQPHAAVVAAVHNDRLVNLSVFDANGVQYARQNVQLLQEDDAAPDEAYAEWMPYQKEQAYQPPEPLIGLFGGSPRFSGAHDIGGGIAISGADLLDFAFAESGLNVDQWNALAGEDIDEILDATLDRIRAESRKQMVGDEGDTVVDPAVVDRMKDVARNATPDVAGNPDAIVLAAPVEVIAELAGKTVEEVVAEADANDAGEDEPAAVTPATVEEVVDFLSGKSEDPVT